MSEYCKLSEEIIKTPTHYVGKSGKEYFMYRENMPTELISKSYSNGNRDYYNHLPKYDYPYTYKYKVEHKWEFCKHCDCTNRFKIKQQ